MRPANIDLPWRFVALLFAQAVSVFGSAMTAFALPIWIFQHQGTATSVSVAALCVFLPRLIFAPFIGTLVDAVSKKLLLVVCEAGQLLIVGVLLLSVVFSAPPLWVLYVLLFIGGIFGALQYPCIASVTPLLVSDRHLTRANSAVVAVDSVANLLGPLLTGLLLTRFSLPIVLGLDVSSFLFAIVMFVPIGIPRTHRTVVYTHAHFLKESVEGVRYLLLQKGLLQLLMVNGVTNLMFSVSFTLLTPMILLVGGHDVRTLGFVLSVGGGAQLVGALIVGTWGGPKNRVSGELVGNCLLGICGPLLIGCSGGPIGWYIGYSATMVLLPFLNSVDRSIWQAGIPSNLHGRAFSIKRMISGIFAPIGFASAGPMVDRWLEPALSPPAGAGYRITFIVAGIIIALMSLCAFFSKSIRGLNRLKLTAGKPRGMPGGVERGWLPCPESD